MPGRDSMPLGQTASTTRRRRMLCDENRVPAHWSLLTIVMRLCWSQSLGDETARVLNDLRGALVVEVGAVVVIEVEPAAKRRR
jgi:hypothetical protein